MYTFNLKFTYFQFKCFLYKLKTARGSRPHSGNCCNNQLKTNLFLLIECHKFRLDSRATCEEFICKIREVALKKGSA